MVKGSMSSLANILNQILRITLILIIDDELSEQQSLVSFLFDAHHRIVHILVFGVVAHISAASLGFAGRTRTF